MKSTIVYVLLTTLILLLIVSFFYAFKLWPKGMLLAVSGAIFWHLARRLGRIVWVLSFANCKRCSDRNNQPVRWTDSSCEHSMRDADSPSKPWKPSHE